MMKCIGYYVLNVSMLLVHVTALGVLCFFVLLFVCLTLLASFFLPSHLSLKCRWNFTVGEVELSLVGGGEEERLRGEEEFSGELPVQVDAARGVVYGEGGGEEEGTWHRQMSAPITAMWVQDGHRLSRVNLSSHSVLPMHQRPTLMMGEPTQSL